jgi:hypothetical protein
LSFRECALSLSKQEAASKLRDALFGDTALPKLLALIGADQLGSDSWKTFAEAEEARIAGETAKAIASLQAVLANRSSNHGYILRLGTHCARSK